LKELVPPRLAFSEKVCHPAALGGVIRIRGRIGVFPGVLRVVLKPAAASPLSAAKGETLVVSSRRRAFAIFYITFTH
jgi:hypothetical protein